MKPDLLSLALLQIDLLTHKLIACGVAATAPVVEGSEPYAGKWDSPQAQQVRALRQTVDALPAMTGTIPTCPFCGEELSDEWYDFLLPDGQAQEFECATCHRSVLVQTHLSLEAEFFCEKT